jgi:protein-S-isoprenylcysteine O-methyltransferase Ste14
MMYENLKFRVALGILTAAVLVIRTPRQTRSFDSGEKQRLEGKLNIALRSLAGLIGIALLIVYLVEPAWIGWAALPMPDWLRWLGAAFGATGVAGLLWVHRELGRNFSATLQIRSDQTLVTSGPYRWVRHPMYTTLYLIVLSFFLVSANWLIGVLWMGSFTAVVMTRLPHEDAALEAKFGDAYRAWAAHTGRLFPRLR